jgi:small-conductance mechanosensitive channel
MSGFDTHVIGALRLSDSMTGLLAQASVPGWLNTAWQFAQPRLLQSLVIIVVAALVYLIASRVILRQAKRLAARTETRLDDLLVGAIRRVLLISIVFWSVLRLLNIWEQPQAGGAVIAVWIIALSLPVSRLVGQLLRYFEDIIATRTETTVDDTALPMINTIARIVIILLAVLVALGQLGIDLSPFLAGAGVIGLALSLAAKDTLANVVAGVLLILDRPFRIGDRIELWSAPSETGTWGDVLEIGLRATKIRNPDNIVVVVPNNLIMQRDIVNYSASGSHIRLRIPIAIAYDADVERAKQLIREAADQTEGVKPDPEPVVIVRSFGASEVNLQLRVWISDARNRRAVADSITERLITSFDEHGIEIPYPKRDIYVRTVPAEGDSLRGTGMGPGSAAGMRPEDALGGGLPGAAGTGSPDARGPASD